MSVLGSPGVVRGVTASLRTASSLPGIDYADRFDLATDVRATPEQWARAMFGDVPSAAEVAIWRGLLGLRLSPGRSPDTVGGWRIGVRDEDRIRLETASASLRAEMHVETGAGRVSWTTCLHHTGAWSRLVWPPASAAHRRLVPRVLRDAERRLRARG
jgi:hypothetical protein